MHESPNILFLGFVLSKEQQDWVCGIDPLPAMQTFNFGWSFARALKYAFPKTTLLSCFPVQSYPVVKRILFRRSCIEGADLNGEVAGFLNLPVLKHVTRFFNCFWRVVLWRWRRRTEGCVLVIHGVHSAFLLVGFLVRFCGVRTVVVLTDPPGQFLPSDGRVSRSLKVIDATIVKALLMNVDGIISLSEKLAENLCTVKRALFFPGIVSADVFRAHDPSGLDCDAGNRIMSVVYAGGLFGEYGVRSLLDAAVMLNGANVNCVFYGKGPLEKEIVEASRHLHSVVYGGFISDRDRYIDTLSSADVLINPRPPKSFVSTVSFPSKLLEYAATGVPVVTTLLDGIPASLAEKLHILPTANAEDIVNTVLLVKNCSARELNQRAQEAKEIVRNLFSEESTSVRLKDFISGLASSD